MRSGRLMRTTTSAPPRDTISRRLRHQRAGALLLRGGDRVFEVEDDRVGAAPVPRRRQSAARSPARTASSARRAGRCGHVASPASPMIPSRAERLELGAVDAERAQDLGGVLAERRRRAAQAAGRRGQARDDVVHRRCCPISCVGHVDDDLARQHVRVGEELVDVVDRRGGDLGGARRSPCSRPACARAMKSTIGASQSRRRCAPGRCWCESAGRRSCPRGRSRGTAAPTSPGSRRRCRYSGRPWCGRRCAAWSSPSGCRCAAGSPRSACRSAPRWR